MANVVLNLSVVDCAALAFVGGAMVAAGVALFCWALGLSSRAFSAELEVRNLRDRLARSEAEAAKWFEKYLAK